MIFLPDPEGKRAAWIAGLPGAQAARVYAPFAVANANRAGPTTPELPRLGRYILLQRTDGQYALVDPSLPWNNPVIYVGSLRECEEKAAVRPGSWYR
jgi:hypothetical protein